MYKSKAYLYQRYVVEKKTVVEIAKEAGCSVMTVQNWLEKFGLLRNPRSWTR
jgi:transposase-like protein